MIVFIVGGRVHRQKHLTALEALSFVNVTCLSFVTILLIDESYSNIMSINVIVCVSVSIEILLFIIIFTVHCYFAFNQRFPNSMLYCKACVQTPSEHEAAIVSVNIDVSPAHIITNREELIFDTYFKK